MQQSRLKLGTGRCSKLDEVTPLLTQARLDFHAKLLANVLRIDSKGCPSNADKDNKLSVSIASGIAEQIGDVLHGLRLAGQSSGNQFEQIVSEYIQFTFPKLSHLRPGEYSIAKVSARDRKAIARFSQYSHLDDLYRIAESNEELQAVLGNAYVISPDVVIERALVADEEINRPSLIVNDKIAHMADIRESNGGLPILHASLSCKWTIRTDRAQNSRSEAVNFIRNRKGRLPHIVVITGEPLPSRLSSLALGTGDIDCVYHFALPELISAVDDHGNSDNQESLRIMTEGKRLKDISDLPLDLCV